MPDLSHFPALGRYRFHLRLLDPVRLPAYPGSTWRGLLLLITTRSRWIMVGSVGDFPERR